MQKRPVTADELLARAEANSHKRGKHQEKDEVRDGYKHVKKTQYDQNAALNCNANTDPTVVQRLAAEVDEWWHSNLHDSSLELNCGKGVDIFPKTNR
jgi:hypothetical protein